jgi:hypothetical protein
MPKPWRHSKKLRRACGGNPLGTRTRHTVEVWFQDEMRVGQKNKLTYRWARKGSRPRATHDQRTQSTYLFGAVCPERGAGAGLVLPACNCEAMHLHLDEIATKVVPGAHAILLLDQAGWRGAKALVVPSNVSLLPLPPRAPELNGHEHTHRPTLEDHVHCATRLGSSRSFNLRIGIRLNLTVVFSPRNVCVAVEIGGRLSLRAGVKKVLRQAWDSPTASQDERVLRNLARQLDHGALASQLQFSKGLDEMLTVIRIGLSDQLRRFLGCTNAIESLMVGAAEILPQRQTLARRFVASCPHRRDASDTNETRPCGRGPREERGRVPFASWKTLTSVALLRCDRVACQ